MIKLTISSLLLTSFLLSPLAYADNQTVTLGYAQSKWQNFKNIKGANLKYRYEWDTPLSVISSFTYMTANKNYHKSQDISGINDDTESYDTLAVRSTGRYFSLSAGPAYRFNDIISAYGLLGINYSSGKDKAVWKEDGETYRNMAGNVKAASFMYGAGIQINPTENIAIDIGYEGSRVNFNGRSYSVNGFNTGVGYRF